VVDVAARRGSPGPSHAEQMVLPLKCSRKMRLRVENMSWLSFVATVP
jgi:hypothetical protein